MKRFLVWAVYVVCLCGFISVSSDLLHKRLTEVGADSTYVQLSRAGHGDRLTIPINLDMMARFFSESLAAWRNEK